MTRDEALQQLQSQNQRDRLSAARILSRLATQQDLPALQGALRVEPVPWIRAALESGLARAAASPETVEVQVDAPPLITEYELEADVYSRAVEELTDRFVHEFRPLVGLARVHAQREVPDFERSQTAALLRRMQTLLRGIDTLGKAAAPPKLRTVDLARIIGETAVSCTEELRAELIESTNPSLDGPEPLFVNTDPDLLTLALRNGVKNALEASIKTREPVVISWGQSSVEFWVAVLDFGTGLPPDGMGLFSIGSTSKPEHFGIGLAIVERVAATLDGTPTLESLPDGTTRFELRFRRADPQ